MSIAIAERLHPFFHQFGKSFLIPGSHWKVAIFPTRLLFTEVDGAKKQFAVDFSLRGPIKGFTAELDLERGLISVWGTSEGGFIRYRLFAKKDGIWIQIEKAPDGRLVCTHTLSFAQFQLTQQEHLLIPIELAYSPVNTVAEQLSLGNHKKQDWELVRRRMDLKEIFPQWLRLGQLTPHADSSGIEGMYGLLETCRSLIAQERKPEIAQAFRSLFIAAFEGICVPRTFDCEFQGIVSSSQNQMAPAIPLLTQSAQLIRSLFFTEKAGVIALLPCLPPEFHCGRFVDVKTESGSTVHFEWTKKFLRTAMIASANGDKLILRLPKEVVRFRVQRKVSGGKKLTLESAKIDERGSVYLSLKPGDTLYLDRFES